MKYWYDDATLDKTIMFYRKMDDSIIVFYFNGNVEEIKYNEDIEKELIQDMLNQAEARNADISVNDLKKIGLRSDIKLFTAISVGFIGGIIANVQIIEDTTRLIFGWTTLISSVIAFLEEKKNNNIGKQIEELEKYKLYLSIRKEIEDNFNQSTFKGIKFFDGNFNINTLDDYSLDEIKKKINSRFLSTILIYLLNYPW